MKVLEDAFKMVDKPQDIQDEFGNVEPPKVDRLEKSTEGLTETGKLKKSIFRKSFYHIARKKARAEKRRF